MTRSNRLFVVAGLCALSAVGCGESGAKDLVQAIGQERESPMGSGSAGTAALPSTGTAGMTGMSGAGMGAAGMSASGGSSAPPQSPDAGEDVDEDASASDPDDGGMMSVDASVPRADAGTDAGVDVATPDAAVPPPLFPPLSTPATRIPSPDNPPQCPAEAPADPWGPCAGLPVYLACNYGTYACICDWIHWICVG